MNENLPELRDIHIPSGVDWFPPAYGWFVIGLAIILLPFIFRLIKNLRTKSRKMYALHLLNRISPTKIVPAAVIASELLRRICVYKYPEAAAMAPTEWLNFLNNHCTKKIVPRAGMLLSDAPYIAKNSTIYTSNDFENLRDFCRKWIGENL